MEERKAFSRTELLLGAQAMEKLAASRVAVFGVGGVGGFVCEALARSGVGALDLTDSDTVTETTRENLTGVRVIRAFRMEQREAEKFRGQNRVLVDMLIQLDEVRKFFICNCYYNQIKFVFLKFIYLLNRQKLFFN